MSRTLTYQVDTADVPSSLGGFLRRRGYSEDLLTQLRQTSGVAVDGLFRRMIDPLAAGETVTVSLPAETASLAPNAALALTVLYEDEDILAIDKPADMLVHPAGYGFDDAVGNFCAARWPDMAFRPLGRLDRNTTGVCLIAKHQLAAAVLTEQGVDKDYFAVAEGLLPKDSGEIDAPLLRVPGKVIHRVVDAAGKPSVTRYQVLRRLPAHTWLRLRLITGRTHQIRAHLSWLGHPLAGDALYGGSTALIGRQALHCGRVTLRHPLSGELLEINSPLPEDIRHLLIL